MISRICAVSGERFVITDQDLQFYQRMDVPLPTLCPAERSRRRLSWRNGRHLYNRTCDATGKKILSIHHPKAPFPVFDYHYWWSDGWDSLDYGMNFDFSRPFFAQFADLYRRVPQINLQNSANENSDYTSYAGWNKNCYWIFYSDHNQDCCYLEDSFYCRDCLDCSYAQRCELCYQVIGCADCYQSCFLQDCRNCVDSWFLKSCVGCSNCFGSVNLRHKQYYFFNKPCSKEEYFEQLSALELTSIAGLQTIAERFADHKRLFPHRYMEGLRNEDVSGDQINNSQNVNFSFNADSCRDSSFLYDCQHCIDCYDMDGWGGTDGAQLVYEGHTVGEGAFNIAFCNYTFTGAANIYYSDLCVNNCHDLFGCVSCKKNSYCILNKQYTADDYFALREKIVEHMKGTAEWGEFFPITLSPYAYNETMAQQFFPLSRTEAVARGYHWRKQEKVLPPEGVVEKFVGKHGESDAEEVCSAVRDCLETGRPYKVQEAEFRFYQRMKLPVPVLHPDWRYQKRLELRNPRSLFQRSCMDCNRPIQTVYAPDRAERVVCSDCYQYSL